MNKKQSFIRALTQTNKHFSDTVQQYHDLS